MHGEALFASKENRGSKNNVPRSACENLALREGEHLKLFNYLYGIRWRTLEHKEFLHQDQSDPREAFVDKLVQDCGTHGTIIVYNQAFEIARNNELAADFSEYAESIRLINDRVIDLLVPFRSRWLYHPSQKGSASIKAVLPAFTDLSYDDLEISHGGEAMPADAVKNKDK